jgi:urease accessory protein UreF
MGGGERRDPRRSQRRALDRRPAAARHRRLRGAAGRGPDRRLAGGESAEVARLDADFLASRESAELRAETAQMGFSMRRLLRDLRDDSLAPVLALVEALPEVAFPTVWAGIAAAGGSTPTPRCAPTCGRGPRTR